MIELFVLKLLDCLLSTAKTIFLTKNRNFVAALCNTSSALLFFAMVSKIAKNGSWGAMALVCLATFIGSYLPGFVMSRLERDKVYIFDVTPDSNETGKKFADAMRENNFPVLTYKGYNKSKEMVLCCKVFSENKGQSRLVAKMIPDSFKFHVVETKSYAFD